MLRKNINLIMIGITICVTLFVVISSRLKKDDDFYGSNNTATPKPSIENTEPDYVLTAEKFHKEFIDNPIYGEDKYKHNIIEVIGILSSIDKDRDSIRIDLSVNRLAPFSFTRCYCSYYDKSEIATKKLEQRVRIKGVCTGFDGFMRTPILHKCIFIE